MEHFIGLNDGSFPTEDIYPIGYYSLPYSIRLAHLNNDIAIVNYETNYLMIFFIREEWGIYKD